ncbi:hypothetical protein [Streptomyces sp. NPDC048425]|uniref:hypothetical protein n=1 Tax=Streptomyces sp. NPDC048425 TaxID=3365548 RepID=UPI003718CC81
MTAKAASYPKRYLAFFLREGFLDFFAVGCPDPAFWGGRMTFATGARVRVAMISLADVPARVRVG